MAISGSTSNVVTLRGSRSPIGVRLRGELFERRRIEDATGCVVHFGHEQADAAGRRIAAFIARPVVRSADALHGRQAPVEDPQDGSHRNIGGALGQGVPPAFPLFAVQHAVLFQLEQDELQASWVSLLRWPNRRLRWAPRRKSVTT